MKVIILVTGSKELEPWNSNWKECERTWVPLLRELGYDIKISFGDSNIEDYFLDEGNHIKLFRLEYDLLFKAIFSQYPILF